jgi:hypothetical protein
LEIWMPMLPSRWHWVKNEREELAGIKGSLYISGRTLHGKSSMSHPQPRTLVCNLLPTPQPTSDLRVILMHSGHSSL